MKEKFKKIDQSKLPKKVVDELKAIEDGTEKFDADLVDAFQENFDTLYKHIEKTYPEALGKKVEAKKTAAKKSAPAKKPAEKKETSSLGKDIDECYEVVKQDRKEKREANPPVKHTADTKLGGALGKIVNLVLDKIKDDPKKMKEFQTYILKVEEELRTKYLSLKRDNIREDIKEKIEEKVKKVA